MTTAETAAKLDRLPDEYRVVFDQQFERDLNANRLAERKAQRDEFVQIAKSLLEQYPDEVPPQDDVYVKIVGITKPVEVDVDGQVVELRVIKEIEGRQVEHYFIEATLQGTDKKGLLFGVEIDPAVHSLNRIVKPQGRNASDQDIKNGLYQIHVIETLLSLRNSANLQSNADLPQ